MAPKKLSNNGDTLLKKREIIEALLENSHDWKFSKKACDDKGLEVVLKHMRKSYHPHEQQEIRKHVQILRSNFELKYKKYRGHRKSFFKENAAWLNTYFRLPAKFVVSLPSTSIAKKTPPVRKGKLFQHLSQRSKQRKLVQLSKQQVSHSLTETIMAASLSAKVTKQQEWASAINSVSSPGRAKAVISKLQQPDLKAFTPEEALNFFLEKRMSVNVYKEIRKESKLRGADIYPHYSEINLAREKCRPSSRFIQVEDFTAVVSTEALLHNTAERLIKLQEIVLEHVFTTRKISQLQLNLVCSWGCDGSSSQSIYKQKSKSDERDNFDESNLFSTTMTPLRLVALVGKRQKELVIWNNELPQSYRSCRPLKLQYKKETKQLTLQEISRVQEEIEALSNFETVFKNGKKISVSFTMLLTVIDGKVLAAIEDTSVQCCPLCKSKPTDFNKKEYVGTSKFEATRSSLLHGASCLHARIRFMEALVHIGMRIELKVWRVTEAEDKEKVALRKKEIQEKFKSLLNLRIDFPNAGGSGTSNDGNTSRLFFENYQISASILGINEELVFRFRNILIAINSQLPLKAIEFGKYCIDTNNMYVDLYGWYKMPSSVHKILVHSQEIILSSILPLGMLSEEGAESRHKFLRGDRLNHARKNSRVNALRDVFNRSLDTSDPFIAAYSVQARKRLGNRKPLPSEVLEFLEEHSISSSSQSSAGSSLSNDEALSQTSDIQYQFGNNEIEGDLEAYVEALGDSLVLETQNSEPDA